MVISDGYTSESSPGALRVMNTSSASKSPTFSIVNLTVNIEPATEDCTGSPTSSNTSTTPVKTKSGAAGILSTSMVLRISSVLTPDSFTILKLSRVEPSVTVVESQLNDQSWLPTSKAGKSVANSHWPLSTLYSM